MMPKFIDSPETLTRQSRVIESDRFKLLLLSFRAASPVLCPRTTLLSSYAPYRLSWDVSRTSGEGMTDPPQGGGRPGRRWRRKVRCTS